MERNNLKNKEIKEKEIKIKDLSKENIFLKKKISELKEKKNNYVRPTDLTNMEFLLEEEKLINELEMKEIIKKNEEMTEELKILKNNKIIDENLNEEFKELKKEYFLLADDAKKNNGAFQLMINSINILLSKISSFKLIQKPLIILSSKLEDYSNQILDIVQKLNPKEIFINLNNIKKKKKITQISKNLFFIQKKDNLLKSSKKNAFVSMNKEQSYITNNSLLESVDLLNTETNKIINLNVQKNISKLTTSKVLKDFNGDVNKFIDKFNKNGFEGDLKQNITKKEFDIVFKEFFILNKKIDHIEDFLEDSTKKDSHGYIFNKI